MGILVNKLLAILVEKDIDSIDYMIARIMLEHLNEINDLSIDDISQLCNVSKSKISKFVKSLGFTSFKELREEIPNKEYNSYAYNSNIMKYLNNHSVNDYLEAIENQIDMLKNMDYHKIHQLANDLYKYDYVASFGTVHSETAALNLQLNLAYLKKFIYTSLNDKKQEEYIRNATEDTLIIIFSNSGDYVKKHQLLKGNIQKGVFKKTNAKLWIITSALHPEQLPYIQNYIALPHHDDVSLHAILFNIVIDLIVYEFKKIRE